MRQDSRRDLGWWFRTRSAVSVLVVLLLLTTGQAQSARHDQPDSLEAHSLKVIVRTHNFFKDNEYTAEKLAGYTLPGFTFQPVLRYDCAPHLSLEAGVHLLHFWGADQYPVGTHYSVIPDETEHTAKLFRIQPLFRVRLSFADKLHLVLGSLYNNRYHNLPIPLYNRELSYASDPEAGAQLLLNYKRISLDLWLDWQQFQFRNSAQQEQFVFGLSAAVRPFYKENGYSFNIPLYFMAHHQGGELVAHRQTIVTTMNAAAGLEFRKYFNSRFQYLQLGCLVAGYNRTRTEDAPFHQGWAIYPTLQANAFNTTLELGYWRSGSFVPILGSPHFGNISTNFDGLVFDPMTVLHAQLTYEYDKLKFTNIQIEAGLYVYPPYSGDRPGYDKVIRGSAVGFDFGLHIHFNPEFRLKIQRKKEQ